MKTLFVLLSLCFISLASIAQNYNEQGGYLAVVDATPDGAVYYMTEYLTCEFMSDVDKQLYAKKDLFASFFEYVKANYALVKPSEVDQTSWLTPGRGIDPEKEYNKKIKSIGITSPEAKIVIVEGYEFVCPTE